MLHLERQCGGDIKTHVHSMYVLTCTAVAMSSSVQEPQPLNGKEIAMAFL